MPEAPPSNEELVRAIDDLFYAANQCAMYHFWFLYARPLLQSDPTSRELDLDKFVGNGVLEATLLFVRKTAEFFKPQERLDKPDTIYSYRYIEYRNQEWIVDRDTMYSDLHKRVGHITIQSARYGHAEWPVYSLVHSSLKKWAEFFHVLSIDKTTRTPEFSRKCLVYSQSISAIVSRMEHDLNNEKRA